ncbi:MAG: hypothetical protein VYA30_14475 [Myxococcota bacterium]|nr:hypothetical protein [Myxococcota bacterium]
MIRATLLLLLAFGCSKRTGQVPSSDEGESLANSAEKAAIDNSYIVNIAKSTTALETLAAKSGWADYFTGRYESAIEQFQGRIGQSPDARFGLARAALGLAAAFRRADGLQKQITPMIIKAQKSRPGSSAMSLWHRYVRARIDGQVKGAEADTPNSNNESAKTVELLLKTTSTEPSSLEFARTALSLLEDSATTSGLTQNFKHRLKFRVRLGKKLAKSTHKAWSRLKFGKPDIRVVDGQKTFELWDPGLGDLGLRYYAQMALDALPSDDLCAVYYRAEALSYLDRPQQAVQELRAALASPAKSGSLACSVLSEFLNRSELIHSAKVQLTMALLASGSREDAQVEFSKLEANTLAQKIRITRVRIAFGQPISKGLEFDRDVYKRLFNERLESLGNGAQGVDDVSELALVARYIDIIQRKWADALAAAGQTATAARMRAGAQDKTKAYGRSGRNSVEVLMASALDYLRIGQPRVSLKYLAKLKGLQGITHGLAEQLRDVLSFRAMLTKDGNTATIGQ